MNHLYGMSKEDLIQEAMLWRAVSSIAVQSLGNMLDAVTLKDARWFAESSLHAIRSQLPQAKGLGEVAFAKLELAHQKGETLRPDLYRYPEDLTPELKRLLEQSRDVG